MAREGTYSIGQVEVVLAGEVEYPVKAFAGAAVGFRKGEGFCASC
jgi:hypothetical protein